MRRIRSFTACLGALVAIDLVGRLSFLVPRLTTAVGLCNYAGAVAVLAVLLRLCMAVRWRPRVLLLALLVALPMSVQGAMFQAYGQFVQPADLVLFAQSPGVVLAAARAGGLGAWPWVTLLACLASIGLLPTGVRPLPPRAIALSAMALITLLVMGTAYWRVSPILEHPEAAFACSVAGLLRRTAVLSRAGDHVVVGPQPREGARPNIVLVLGESLVASHLSLYGYARDTSPRLQRLFDDRALVAFRDATVMGPSTRTSLPYILTGIEGPDAHGRVFRAPTVLDYAKARGYHTAFISAQEEGWGNFDVLFREGADTFRSGFAFAPSVDVMRGADDIDVLEQGALPAIHTLAEPFFVVLHMNGGHAPYADHSRAASKVFLPEKSANSINAYDNTVRETDEYLGRLYEGLRARDPDAWLLYTSDHGQALGDGDAFFNHGYQQNVVRDPLLVFPPAAEERRFEAMAGAQVAACDLAPTVVHLMGAKAATPMDCVDWLLLDAVDAGFMRPRVRVVSAYTPAFVSEPTMLLVLEDGTRELFDLGRGTVDFDGSEPRKMSDVGMPPSIAARLR
jgi:hypothetical protein